MRQYGQRKRVGIRHETRAHSEVGPRTDKRAHREVSELTDAPAHSERGASFLWVTGTGSGKQRYHLRAVTPATV